MALPEQIRKQTEAVQELYKQLNPDEHQGSANDANGQNQPNDAANTANAADENSDENYAAQSAGHTEQPPTDNKTEENLNQKYKTLQGMYNAEVPRLHAQNREMQGRVQQLEQLLSTLSQQQQAAPQQQAKHDPLVTDQDVQEYGESIDMMRKVSREELIPVAQKIAQLEGMIRQMHSSVVPQVQAVAQRQAVSAEQQFWADLTGAVPNWQEINNSADFQSWLLEVDPLTGISRQTYLEDAQRTLDTRRITSFFRTWLEMNGQPTGAQPNRNSQGSELERQVAPGRSRSAPASGNQAAKTYSADDIKTFFNDVRSQKYKGREAERDRIERDIFAAQREGRIAV